MTVKVVKKKGREVIRIAVGGKSRKIQRAERRLQKRQREIHRRFKKTRKGDVHE